MCEPTGDAEPLYIKQHTAEDWEKILGPALDMLMHRDFHIPMVKYGYQDGKLVFLKSVSRRKAGCSYCDELYSKYPVVTIG